MPLLNCIVMAYGVCLSKLDDFLECMSPFTYVNRLGLSGTNPFEQIILVKRNIWN